MPTAFDLRKNVSIYPLKLQKPLEIPKPVLVQPRLLLFQLRHLTSVPEDHWTSDAILGISYLWVLMPHTTLLLEAQSQ